MNKSVLSVSLLLALAGCSCSNQAEKQDENQTEDDLTKVERHFEEFHIEGIYDGTFPAADCDGIRTQLVLNHDNTYTLRSEYLGHKGATLQTHGTYHILGDMVIELHADSSKVNTYYKILNNHQLMLSDADGTLNHGALTQYYILTKER